VTPEDKENERLKLMANWCNTLATAVLTAGCIVPASNYLFGVLSSVSPTLIYGTGFVCIGGGVILHLMGQAVLGGLE
jgi:hypothetical protein